MICPKCGTDNQERFKFCMNCATELQSTSPQMPSLDDSIERKSESGVANSLKAAEAAKRKGAVSICPECSAMSPTDFTFCGKCGARMAGTDEATLPSHRPGSHLKAQLVLIRPDGGEAGSFQLKAGSNVIGRGVGPLFDADGYLSPRHADLLLDENGLTVHDLGSLNGVFLKITADETLEHGDVFRVGQQLLRFEQVTPPQSTSDGTQILGSPNPGYWGKLLLVVGPEQDGGAYPLFGDATTIGRERGDVLFAEDGYVSGSHARLLSRDGSTQLSDLRSSNGTFLRIRNRNIPNGSFLLMGQQLFRVALSQ